MRNTPNQGLAGKARRKRVRSRTTRLYHQQLIEDYIERRSESEGSLRDRSIRIGHRKDFVPTADVGLDDSSAGQLNLSLTPTDDQRDAAFVAVPKDSEVRVRPAQHVEHRSAPQHAGNSVVTRQPVASPKPEHATDRNAVSVDSFTWRGFACGCAIGGAVAAVLLLFIRIAFA